MPCEKPIPIKNPNKGLAKIGFNKYKDCESGSIYVPCGHCKACIANRQMQVVQRIQMEEKYNHLFMCTITYNEEMLPHIETSTGYKIAYADVKDIQLMIKRLRNNNAFGRPFRFYAVTELGSKGGRPHAHIIFIVPKESGDNWMTIGNLEQTMYSAVWNEWRRRTGGSKRKPEYKACSTYIVRWVYGKRKCTYDLHYIDGKMTDEGIADAAFYVIKYMMKPSKREERVQQALKMNLPPEEYETIWRKIRSRHFESENFGQLYNENRRKKGQIKTLKQETISWLRDGIEQGKTTNKKYPVYYNTHNGKQFPLARYYRGKIMTLEDMEFYFRNREVQNSKSNVAIHELPEIDIVKQHERQLKFNSDLAEKADFTTLL